MTLLLLASCFTAGTYLGLRTEAPSLSVALITIVAALLALLCRTLRKGVFASVLLLAAAAGLMRVEALPYEPGGHLYSYHGDASIEIVGVVADDPEPAGSASRMRLEVERIRSGGEWADESGELLAFARETPELVRAREAPYFRYGDRLRLTGRLGPRLRHESSGLPIRPDSVMAFPDVELIDEGNGSRVHALLYGMRRKLAESLERVVPEPQAALGQAVLLGVRDGLPDDVVEEFRDTGASHLLAISGLHVGILLGIGLAMSQWLLGRKGQRYLLMPLILIWAYAMLSGMSPSATRATIMGTAYLAALGLGRPRAALPALGLAAAVMAAFDPLALMDVSFQLSFTAMAGIAVIARPMGDRLLAAMQPGARDGANPFAAFMAHSAAMTTAATVATLPLVVFYFGRVSLLGIPATMLTLPALPAVIVSHAAASGAGLVGGWLAAPFGWAAWLTSAYVTAVVDALARLPAASIETGRLASHFVWIYYAVLAAAYFAFRRRLRAAEASDAGRGPGHRRLDPRWRWGLAGAAAAAALVWATAMSMPDGNLHVLFADVGQGDATLVVTPNGHSVLVDGGPDGSAAARLLDSALPFWDRSVDMVVLTHPHADHARGLLEVLRRYEVARVMERSVDHGGMVYEQWRRLAEREGAVSIEAVGGQRFSVDGTLFEVLWPPVELPSGTSSDLNNASVVLRVSYGETSFLLAADIHADAEARLVELASVDSDVLKVPHHGSRTSSSAEFLDAVSPVAAVISVDAESRHGHPHPEVVHALTARLPRDNLGLTSENGTIEFVSDGRRLMVRTER